MKTIAGLAAAVSLAAMFISCHADPALIAKPANPKCVTNALLINTSAGIVPSGYTIETCGGETFTNP